MSAGEPGGDEPPRPFRGFSSNADDTPRALDDEAAYDDAFDEAEPEFDTFAPADDPLTWETREAYDEPASGGVGRAAAVALLVMLAAGVGFALTRGWTSRPPAATPSAAPAIAPVLRPEAAPVEVAANQEPAPPAAPVQPITPDTAPTARPTTPAARPVEVAKVPPRFVAPEVSSDASARLPAPAAVARPAAAPAPIRPSFDCERAQTAAQEMVCSDPRLAAADVRMSRAYAAALAAGEPAEALRSEQADWLEIREDAARYSNRAVLNIYRQRTEELEAMVDEPPE
jgi:uncharacterized protein YecT (DUF1311 family)